jgi:hypothetical protein
MTDKLAVVRDTWRGIGVVNSHQPGGAMRPIAGAQDGWREFHRHITEPRRDAFSLTSVGPNIGTRAKDRGNVTDPSPPVW